MQAEAVDKDYPDNVFLFSWSCWNLNRNQTCRDVFGDTIEFSEGDIQTIAAKHLEPYNTYLFLVEVVSQHMKSGHTEGVIVVTEQQLPSLNVTVPTELKAA
jgi:hypothetical protein